MRFASIRDRWRRSVAPVPWSGLHAAPITAATRRAGVLVAVLWFPAVALAGLMSVTILWTIYALPVFLVVVLPFTLGVRIARGRPTRPDLAIAGIAGGAFAAALCAGVAVHEQVEDAETGRAIAFAAVAAWSALATAATWYLHRRLRRLERLAPAAPTAPLPAP